MPKVEETIPIDVGFSHMEICSNQWDEEGVKDVVEKLEKYFPALVKV